MPGPRMLDDEIGRKLREAEASGELQAAAGYGRPLQQTSGWEQTPDTLRMPFKILKDAGVLPYEVELMTQRAALRQQLLDLAKPPGPGEQAQAQAIQARLAALEQCIALRLESLRRAG